MASSLISNTNQVHFASVLAMDNAGMVAMFEALVASGLNGFLGCMSDIFETALVEFYQNASVRDGKFISTVQGQSVEISEEVFARTFQLPVDGLTDINEVSKDLVFDARTEFSFTGEQLTTSCKKQELKIEFRLLSDILAKSVTVKAGSFDAVTHERFLMMTAITGGVKINWDRLLFNIFKDMVTPGSRQAKGYAVQIYILLKNVPNLNLGDSKEFPPLKILTARTIGRYISINDKIDVEDLEDVADVSRVKKTPVKRAVSKKRPATAAAEMVVKKKRTLKGKVAPSNENLELVSVAQEAVPLQVLKPITDSPPKPKRKAPKRKLILPTGSADEIAKEETDILEDTAQLETDMGDTDETVVGGSTIQTSDDFISGDFQLVTSEADLMIGVENDRDVERRTDDESMTLEEILSTIPAGSSIPSTTGEVTKIQLGKSIQFRVVNEGDRYKASLPKISSAEMGKTPLHEKDPIKGNLTKEMFSLICADIDLLVKLREHVIDEVDIFFNSFSFKKLAALKLEEIYAKEELFLTWAETDSTKLKAQIQAHGLRWEKTCCSKIFEGESRDHGAVIARSNTNTNSSCWIMTMVHVNDSWVIEPCADYWKPIPRQVVCNEVLPQVSYVDTLPTVSTLFKLLRKRWADVCLEAAEFFVSGTLLPVESTSFSLADTSTQEDPIVQTDIDQHPDSPPTSADSSLHFNANDIPTEEDSAPDQLIFPSTATPTITDIAASFAQLRASIDQKRISTQVAAVATGLTDVQKDVQDTKDAFFHRLLDFRAQGQENYNNLTTQLANFLTTSIVVVMTKRGKRVAAAILSHLQLIRIDPVGEVRAEVVVLVEVVEETIEGVLRKGDRAVVVVDLVLVVNLMELIKRMLNGGCVGCYDQQLNSTSVASIFRRWDSVVYLISDATTQVLACFLTNNKTTSFGLIDTTAFGLALEFRPIMTVGGRRVYIELIFELEKLSVILESLAHSPSLYYSSSSLSVSISHIEAIIQKALKLEEQSIQISQKIPSSSSSGSPC
ncbi:hypothetical protein F511_24715 [Dorcoceras hygrometricum]|uniref:Dystroglycan-like n=1 Tax=Dorcoceras hygrometricum TaxID=472368 RepID=A0A2Z7CG91_9LAMI|nr:hypothetical protein F511_24715 [Dorcoceras hygrometricum]